MATKRSKSSIEISKLDMVAETSGDFGDKRLSKRAARVAETWSEGGAASFPKMFGEADLEGLYRLLGNDAFQFTELVAAHALQTSARAKAFAGTIVVTHDSTGIEVPLHDADDVRENFAVKSSRTQGMEAHVSAIFAHDSHNTPLGVAALQPFVHADHVKHDEAVQDYWWAIGGLFGNEQDRWSAAIARTAELLGDKRADAVHVMDREADDFAMLAWLQQCGHRFVVRANTSRRSVVREGKRIAVADGG